jgi:FkbM family methyltransferase
MPIRQMPWRISWLRTTDAYNNTPVRTTFRLLTWTLAECFRSELSFEIGTLSFTTMPNNFCGLFAYVDGYETKLIKYVTRNLKNGDVFIDAGANIGIYAIHVADHLGPKGKVIAFEAHPLIAHYFQRNTVLNKLANVVLVQAAVGAERGIIDIKYNRGNSGSTHIVNIEETGTITIPMVTIDDELFERGVTKVDYLKMDVEGFEPFALLGATQTISNNLNIIVQTEIDIGNLLRYGRDPNSVFFILREMGLRPHILDQHENLEMIESVQQGDIIWFR